MLAWMLALLEDEEDRERFLRLHGAYEKKLYAMSLRLLGNPTQAEDAVQQTWLQVLRYWETVRALSWEEAGGYAVTIAKHVCLDMQKAQRRMDPLPETWDPPAPAGDLSEYRRLVTLVRALPEGYRLVLELKFVEEWTNREIARRLSLNESTVATRVQRGRTLLLEALAKEGYCHEPG